MKKVISILCVFCLMALFMASCKPSGEDNSSSGDSAASGSSGTASGDSASSPSASLPDSLGFSSTDDTPTLNVSAEKALDISTICFDADDEKIYYISDDDEHIYSVKKDGSDKQKLCDDKVSWLHITDDGKIKYATNMETGLTSNSYTMNKDGSNRVSNNELLLDEFGPIERTGKDGKVYYNLAEEEEGNEKPGIYVKNKGAQNSEGTLVFEGIINSFCLLDDYLVVSATRSLEGAFIYRAKLDGADIAKVLPAMASSLVASGDDVYFANNSAGKLIYKTTGDAIRNAS